MVGGGGGGGGVCVCVCGGGGGGGRGGGRDVSVKQNRTFHKSFKIHDCLVVYSSVSQSNQPLQLTSNNVF